MKTNFLKTAVCHSHFQSSNTRAKTVFLDRKTMLELGYSDSRGYAEVSRLLLKYFGVEFKDVRYAFGENYSRKEWFAVKWTMGMDFPNLPYVIDGDFKISQVSHYSSILTYLLTHLLT